MAAISARITKERQKLNEEKIEGILVNFDDANLKHFTAKIQGP